jgi:hypothetical protein
MSLSIPDEETFPLGLKSLDRAARGTSGLMSLREDFSNKTSPTGTAESSPGRSPGYRFPARPVPLGTAENTQDGRVCVNLESLSSTKTGEILSSHTHSAVPSCPPHFSNLPLMPPTQDSVLGHFQSSLRDWSCWKPTPRTASWATLSRPFGTGSRVATGPSQLRFSM